MDIKYELWDKYFADNIYDWDIWSNWNQELIVDRLHDDDVEEDNFTDEEIDYLLDMALSFQKEKQDEDRQENIVNLEDEINSAINNSYSTENLSYDDIGKVLVRIAASYLED